MPFYKVQFLEGGSATLPGGGSNFMGIRGLLRVEAPSRADALIAAHRQLAPRGEVTVLGYRGGDSWPLGFSDQEQEAVRRASVHLTIGYPRAGTQIERIDGESPPPRTALTLEGLPDLVFSSWEADVGGQWTIYYETELGSSRTTFCVLESEGAGLVGQARDRFLTSGVGSFDLDQARRKAADRALVPKVRQALEYLLRQAGGPGSQ
ncbi:MAG: hypothetical protein ACREOQ_19430 [Gemmatimonadales bacterium]